MTGPSRDSCVSIQPAQRGPAVNFQSPHSNDSSVDRTPQPPSGSDAAVTPAGSRAAAITALRGAVADYERCVAQSRQQNSWRDDLLPWRKASHLAIGLGLFRAIHAAEAAAQRPDRWADQCAHTEEPPPG
jgi:hypothetical protein